jgi:F0F1-type ATP synthase membrane subunit b/b'
VVNSDRMKRGSIVVVILISAFSLSGCGGDDGSETTSPSEWADSLCTDLSQWKSSVESVAASFSGGGNLSQEQIQDAVNEVASSTEMLVGNLQDLGRPDTDAGQEAEDAVNQLADELQTDIGEAERAAAGVSSAADAAQAASSIQDTFTTAQDQVRSAVTDLEQLEPQGELTSALEQSDACNELSSS